MKQYIERNALLEELRNDLKDDINIYHSHTAKEIRDEKYEFAIERIEEIPAADVRENIHAKWINAYPEIEPNPMFMYGICSNCGAESGRKSKFCPDCGAVMDLE